MEKYVKMTKIGQGSFGCAYLATRKNDPSKKYVIKEIRMDPRDQQSALKEAQLLAALDHPNIITCKESFTLPSVSNREKILCIVTEYADGGDLRKKITNQQNLRLPFQESEILAFFVQICLALKHLHDRKILHRDIKPENIFLTQHNVVKLGDFGVATVLSHTLACAETLTGTPYYTSPEICLGKKYNHKSDIWSLGCVLYELTTLMHAFNGRSQRQLFDNIIKGNFAPISSSGGRVSSALATMVSDMLKKNPRDRPTVNQLIKTPIVMDRIQRFLSDRAVADELNHTVLHGQHIFKRKQPQPAVGMQMMNKKEAPVTPSHKIVAVVQTPGKCRADAQAGNAIRRAEAAFGIVKQAPSPAVNGGGKGTPAKKKPQAMNVMLRRSRSLKKPTKPASTGASSAGVGSPLRSPSLKPKKKVSSPAPMATPRSQEQKNKQQLLQNQKKAIIEQARQKNLQRKQQRPQHVPEQLPPPPAVVSKPADIPDRIAAFNAQWQAQRQNLLNNLMPPPPPTAAAHFISPNQKLHVAGNNYPKPVIIAVDDQRAPIKATSEAAPSPPLAAPFQAKAVAVRRSKKSAADDQRHAMRKDIRARKLEIQKKRANGEVSVGTSEKHSLDDPIILVQNLPDYKHPPSVVIAADRIAAVLPPPPPTTAVVVTSTNTQEDEMVEDEADDEIEVVQQPVVEEYEDRFVAIESSSMPPTPANLEFERMVLQLKSVVECPSDLEDDSNDESDEGEESQDGKIELQDGVIPDQTETMPLSTPPPYFTMPDLQTSLRTLDIAMLNDPKFKQTLVALLHPAQTSASEVDLLLQAIPLDQQPVLQWVKEYITTIIQL